MSYDGPKHKRLTKRLRKIASLYGLRVKFTHNTNGEYCVGADYAVVSIDNPSSTVISTFFHELGHHVDYHRGLFYYFYSHSTSLDKMRKVALKAERHADKVGKALAKRYFPDVEYEDAYRSPEHLYLLKLYYTAASP